MAEITRDAAGCDALQVFVEDSAGGRISGKIIAEARADAPVDTGALKASGRVIRMSRTVWRIIFGEGLPDGRAVYQELGTRYIAPRAYIRRAVYRERGE